MQSPVISAPRAYILQRGQPCSAAAGQESRARRSAVLVVLVALDSEAAEVSIAIRARQISAP